MGGTQILSSVSRVLHVPGVNREIISVLNYDLKRCSINLVWVR